MHLLLEKSLIRFVFVLRYNGPSGHPEPKNLGLDDVLPDPSRELSEAVRRELFQSALDEAED